MAAFEGSLRIRGGIEEAAVHNIPTKTSYCGPADVQSYFRVSSDPSCLGNATPSDKDHLIASFRGRTLRGAQVSLPEGYSGYAIRPVHAGPEGLEGSEELEAVHRFSKVTAWNHDVKAADSDSLPALLEWAAVSSILHAARPTA